MVVHRVSTVRRRNQSSDFRKQQILPHAYHEPIISCSVSFAWSLACEQILGSLLGLAAYARIHSNGNRRFGIICKIEGNGRPSRIESFLPQRGFDHSSSRLRLRDYRRLDGGLRLHRGSPQAVDIASEPKLIHTKRGMGCGLRQDA